MCRSQCCRCDTGAAAKGLVFDAALIGADENSGIIELLYKIDIDAFRDKFRTVPDFFPFPTTS